MKKLALTIVFALLSAFTFDAAAQVPPPPPSGGHGATGNQPAGNGAPIGSGLFILLGLGAAYGGKKVYDFHSASSLDGKRDPAN